MIARQQKDAKEGRNIFSAGRKSRKIAVAVCIQVGLLHDVIHEGRWEDFTPNGKWRLWGGRETLPQGKFEGQNQPEERRSLHVFSNAECLVREHACEKVKD